MSISSKTVFLPSIELQLLQLRNDSISETFSKEEFSSFLKRVSSLLEMEIVRRGE